MPGKATRKEFQATRDGKCRAYRYLTLPIYLSRLKGDFPAREFI